MQGTNTTTAQERLDALLGACTTFLHKSQPETHGRMMAVQGDVWEELRSTVQRISAEVGAEAVAEQERRQSET